MLSDLEVFEHHYAPQFEDNTVKIGTYLADAREYQRRVFDIYRYAKTSLQPLGEDLPFKTVRKFSTNKEFDTGTFLLR